ncbi:hypothetical protein Pint_27063 [Pistacia integerrima]|uniref:Uncharacterized protein n=1 Tax=Pistacia integerrima TaxID=434235 RepID=A0ACC0YRE2_9ROSI|nr:hypothetical protein Pint_27063 [Pistacia integerrima]
MLLKQKNTTIFSFQFFNFCVKRLWLEGKGERKRRRKRKKKGDEEAEKRRRREKYLPFE